MSNNEQNSTEQTPENNQQHESEVTENTIEDLENILKNVEDESAQDDAPNIADEQVQIARLEKLLAEEKDKSIRSIAEIENIKRRAQKDLENAHKFAVEGLVKELILVLDSFDGAKQATAETDEKSLQGLLMIEENFIQVLQKHGVEVILPNKGDEFNPEQHQAMTSQPHEEYAVNQIVNVFQRGFAVKGRLIRPAMVVVSS